MNEFEEKVMDEFSEVKQRIASMETTIKTLPCSEHSKDLNALNLSKAYLIGIVSSVSLLISALFNWIKG